MPRSTMAPSPQPPALDGGTDPVAAAREDWARERPDLDTEPMEVFGRLIRTRMLAEARISASLNEHGLSLAAFDVLASLRRAGSPFRKTPTELATTSMLTTGGVTFRLDRLEAADLIRRVRSTEDRRVVFAELTERGKGMIDAAFDAHLENERALLSALSPEETRQLARLLQRLETSMATTSDAAA